jgi:hypothetical protein
LVTGVFFFGSCPPPPPPTRQLNITGGQRIATRFYNGLRGFATYFSLSKFTEKQRVFSSIPRGGRISATLNARGSPPQKSGLAKITLYHHIQRIFK